MTVPAHPVPSLSPTGHARREHILSLASQALASRRRRQRTIRIVTATGLPALTLVIVLASAFRDAASSSSSPSLPAPRFAESRPVTPAPSRPRSLVQRVSTDNTALDRALVTTHVIPPSTYIDDDQLQAFLRESGRDPGIVRVGRRVVLSSELAAMSSRPKIPG